MQKAAIKKMDMQASREFLAELNVLTRVHHLNLVMNYFMHNVAIFCCKCFVSYYKSTAIIPVYTIHLSLSQLVELA